MANPSRLDKIQITANTNSATATKVNVQEANGEVNTQAINTAFNKNFGLNAGDVVDANTLLNQYSTTPLDWTATAYNIGQVVFFVGKQWISKMVTAAGDVPADSSKWEEITFEALANKTFIVDAIPTDGSNNAVSSNGVFDALATKAPISSVHNPVTLGTANGLSLSTQQLSLGLASSGVTGALSGTDWNTFNNKQNALGFTPENVVNKQNSLAVDGTGAKYPTVDAVNGGLALKNELIAHLKFNNADKTIWNNGYSNVTTATSYGEGAGRLASGGNWTANGFQAGFSNTTGGNWTANGFQAGFSNTTGYNWAANGFQAGFSNTTGSYWTANGFQAGYSNTTGGYWTANGSQAGYSNTTGSYWTANGFQAGYSNTTGGNWTANGFQAGFSNTTGYNWTANGLEAGYSNTTGSYWTANGSQAGYSNTTGSYWTANGFQAGRYLANGTSPLLKLNNGVFIGADTKALEDNSINEIVIGYNATGLGSNSSVIGNSSTLRSRIWGRFLSGTSVDDGVNQLQVAGTISASPATTANQVPTWGQVQAIASSGTYTPSNQTNAAQTVNFMRSYWERKGNVLTVTTSLTYTVTQIQSTASFSITLPNGFLVSGANGRIIGSSLLHNTQAIFNNNANMKAYEIPDSSQIKLQACFQATVSSGTYETTIIYTVLIQ